MKNYLTQGRVDQFGMIAALASLRPRVQIPPRPPRTIFLENQQESSFPILLCAVVCVYRAVDSDHFLSSIE